MRTHALAATALSAAGLIALGGCHDGYSSVGYSYNYGSYGSPCDTSYHYSYPAISSYSFRYSSGHHHHGHHRHHGHHGHRGHHRGHHHGRSHCPY